MWNSAWRERTWSELDQPWDVLVVGGGITGAGILRESQRLGLQTLLVEARDFASGTSSRSSNLVHGGLRYLRNAQLNLTRKSVRERDRLVKEGRGLVNPLGILLLNYHGDAIPAWAFGLGLALYDILATKWGHRHYDELDLLEGQPMRQRDYLFTAYKNVQRAVRTDRWKLIRYPQVNQTQLFDLQNDSHELNYLASNPEYAGKVNEILALLVVAQEQCGDTCPLTVADPKPAKWTPPDKLPAKKAKGKS